VHHQQARIEQVICPPAHPIARSLYFEAPSRLGMAYVFKLQVPKQQLVGRLLSCKVRYEDCGVRVAGY
jgi:hypothetical protein